MEELVNNCSMLLHLMTTIVFVKNRNYSSQLDHLITLYKMQMRIEQNGIRGYDKPKRTGEETFVGCFKILPWHLQDKLSNSDYSGVYPNQVHHR
jgi:hypothetical protein